MSRFQAEATCSVGVAANLPDRRRGRRRYSGGTLLRSIFASIVGFVATTANAQYASHGIAATSPLFTGWATGVSNLTRGPQNIANSGLGLASFGTAAAAIGAPDGWLGAVSLGDGGSITVTFGKPIANAAGADFAVFENGFISGNLIYAELGFVEVSSNGKDFFRFASTSLTQTTTQTGGFGGTDPTKINNLAGQFVAFEGTPFDLDELKYVSPLLDVNDIISVRIIDVVGSLDDRYATFDSHGNKINDPWATPFASSGFDLDAVGVIHAVPETPTVLALGIGVVLIFPRRRRSRL